MLDFPQVGAVLSLQSRTRKGKNRLHEAGTTRWEVMAVSDSLICFKGAPGIAVQPAEPHADPIRRRWLRLTGDPDFCWTVDTS